MRTWGTMAVRVIFVFLPLTLVACQTLIRPCGPDGECETGRWPALHLAGPPRYQAPTMHSLACDLDHLERHIDCYGSVVAKVPDVWGQARLTQYREEFEKVMASEVNNFQVVINGSESRSDQAYFASATALSFAAQPKPPVIGTTNSMKGNAPTLVPTSQTVQQVTKDPTTGATTTTDTTLGPAPTPAPPARIQPLPLDDPSKMVSSIDTVIHRNDARLAAARGFQYGAIGLEPAEYLAQKKRYLDFLNQLRRENEGDDTADSPGYSLNLMRIPVSVLPGKRTDVGFGAEITMTLNPILGNDLLPMTFRNLVTNDVVKQLGLPLAQVLGDKGSADVLDPQAREDVIGVFLFTRIRNDAKRYVAELTCNKLAIQQFFQSVVVYYRELVPEDRIRLVNLGKKLDEPLRIIFEQLQSGELERRINAGAYGEDVIAFLEKFNKRIAAVIDWRKRLEAAQHEFMCLQQPIRSSVAEFAKGLPSTERARLEGMLTGDYFTWVRQKILGEYPHVLVIRSQLNSFPSDAFWDTNAAKLMTKALDNALTTPQIMPESLDSSAMALRREIVDRLPPSSDAKRAAAAIFMKEGLSENGYNLTKWVLDPKVINAIDDAVDRELSSGVLRPFASPGAPGGQVQVPMQELGTIDFTKSVQGIVNLSIKLKSLNFAFTPGLDRKVAFPVSQLIDVYGLPEVITIAQGANQALKDQIAKQKYAHLPDVQGFLQNEVFAAYEFLARPECVYLWDLFCQRIVASVRTRKLDEMQNLQREFRAHVRNITHSDDNYRKERPYNPQGEYSVTASLAWCILVDSALLTNRLVLDIQESATGKGKSAPPASCCQFYLPNPPQECRDAFSEYVKLRWPIRVFALDPYNQEENIADSLSTRRELQLALSIAFTNGQINARQLTQYARRLEAEYETISLVRTQIGFSHGESTFGWRFFPRYQTPDTPTNFAAFRETVIGGPNRNQLLRQRRLEPGLRECVAIVMMPSFVPYVQVDTLSNWFPLTNPKHKCLDTKQAMRLSHTVQTIKSGSCNVNDACDYRPDELERLNRRADQLEARLPTQTLTSPVPILNTLGGFEMFSNGTTDLAPELFGWYGAPGIDPEAESTTLFLVGDHFSPLRTRVIVGNQAIYNGPSMTGQSSSQQLLSRQVMQVTFTKGAYTVGAGADGGGEVRIHVATPYGVTRELSVPVSKVKPQPKPGFSFGTAKMVASYGMVMVGSDKFLPFSKPAGNDADVKITWNSPAGMLSAYVAIEMTFEYKPAGAKNPVILKVPCRGAVLGGTAAKEIVIPKESLNIVASELIRQLSSFGPFAVAPNPFDSGLKTKTVTITPLVPPGTVAQVATTVDSLSVQFKAEGVCFGDSLNTNLAPISPALSAVAGVPVAASIVPCGPFMPPAPPIIGYPVPPPPFFPADSPPTVILPDCWPRPIIPCPVPIPMAPPIHGSALPHPTQCEPGTPGKK